MARKNLTPTARGTVTVTGGASGLIGAGGFSALAADATPAQATALFGICAVLALFAGLTKLYELRTRRTAEYISSVSLARTALRHDDSDRSMRLLVLDRALSNNSSLTPVQMGELLMELSAVPEEDER